MSFETSLRIAQRAHDAALAAGSSEDWRDEATIRASESTLSALENLLGAAVEFDDLSAIEFWADEIAARPQPENLNIYNLATGEDRVLIFDEARGIDISFWPLWLEALCPGYSPAVALRAAAQTLTDTRDFLHQEYIP